MYGSTSTKTKRSRRMTSSTIKMTKLVKTKLAAIRLKMAVFRRNLKR